MILPIEIRFPSYRVQTRSSIAEIPWQTSTLSFRAVAGLPKTKDV